MKKLIAALSIAILCNSYSKADTLKIEGIDDCERIGNNIYYFWKNHQPLIDTISNNKKIPLENIIEEKTEFNNFQMGMIYLKALIDQCRSAS